MELTKKAYKQNLKSILIPTLELIIDQVVDNSNDDLYNSDNLHSNAHFFKMIARERITQMLCNSKEVRESLEEYISEILKYKSPQGDKKESKEIVLDRCLNDLVEVYGLR